MKNIIYHKIKFFIWGGLLLLSFNVSIAQKAKKPSIMVIPSDPWCNAHGYIVNFNEQGRSINVSDYSRAFREDIDLTNVIAKIGQLMQERGFPLKDAASAIQTAERESVENSMLTSEISVGTLSETPYDRIVSRAKSDIVVKLTWSLNNQGPKKSLTFTLDGVDAYTNIGVATISGTGASSFSTETAILLEEAVLSYIDGFCNNLQSHFEDMFANGREVNMSINIAPEWGNDFETYYGETQEELALIIEDWIADNAVEGVYNMVDQTNSVMKLSQIRIPMFYERNGRQRAMSTKNFGDQLRTYLRRSYGIESSIVSKGLGNILIVLGQK